MSYLYRCGHCRKRRALKRLHTDYIRQPKCKVCCHDLTYRDVWQEVKNKESCKCDAFHYPHRPGSSIYCIEYKKELTQDEINDFNNYRR